MSRRRSKRLNKAGVGKASRKQTTPANQIPNAAAEKPTPEMLARVEFVLGQVKTEMGIPIGMAYRRRPLFQTMARSSPDRFTSEELAALALYRLVFDRCDRSPMASSLSANMQGGRGVGALSVIYASPAVVEAKRKLRILEHALGQTVSTMRDFVLHDRSFSEIAIERYGHRVRRWIIVDEPVIQDGKPVLVAGKPLTHAVHREDLAPRSGRDRTRIADEFNRGVKLLARAAERMSHADIEEIWVQPRDDGTAVIHRASIAPNGLFRLWGTPSAVDAVLDALLATHDEQLAFSSPEAARDALLEADAGRLQGLGDEELAR